jgi:hypothetical protein
MEENKLFALFWKLLATALCVFIVTVGGCSAHQNYLLAHSSDPVATACALGSSTSACMVVASR